MRSVASHRKRDNDGADFVTRLRDWLAVAAIVLGGLWAATEFFWDRVVAPLLEPALIQGETTHRIVSETDCCVFAEISFKFTNHGKRSAHLITSNLVVGARSMKLLARSDGFDQEQENSRVLATRANVTSDGLRAAELPLHFGTAVPATSSYAVLVTGDVLRPRTTLSPNESVSRQIAVLIPKDQPFVSVRATLVVAHSLEVARETVWSWRSNETNLASQVMPWPEKALGRLQEVRECALNGATPADAVRCDNEAMTQARAIWSAMGKVDPHFYTAPYVYDFAAVRDSRATLPAARK